VHLVFDALEEFRRVAPIEHRCAVRVWNTFAAFSVDWSLDCDGVLKVAITP